MTWLKAGSHCDEPLKPHGLLKVAKCCRQSPTAKGGTSRFADGLERPSVTKQLNGKRTNDLRQATESSDLNRTFDPASVEVTMCWTLAQGGQIAVSGLAGGMETASKCVDYSDEDVKKRPTLEPKSVNDP